VSVCVCVARISVLILCQVDDVIGVKACRAAQRWVTFPPVVFCRLRLFLDGVKVIETVCLNRCHWRDPSK